MNKRPLDPSSALEGLAPRGPDPCLEVHAPAPTHFRLREGGFRAANFSQNLGWMFGDSEVKLPRGTRGHPRGRDSWDMVGERPAGQRGRDENIGRARGTGVCEDLG